MLVDDEASITRMIRRNLETTGRFEVLDVNDPMQVVTKAKDFKPDLVFLDVMMPNKDGGELAADFREEPLLADTPIVFLTAIVSRTEVPPTGSVIGEHLFLAKPVTLENLLACIDKILGAN